MSVDDEPRKDATGETGYPRRLEELAGEVAALDEARKDKLCKLVDEYSKLEGDRGLFVIAYSTNGTKYLRCRTLAEKAALVAAIHDLVIERDSCRKRIDDYAHLFLIHWDPAQLAIRRLNEFGDPAILELDVGLKMLFGTKGRNRRAAKKRVRKIIAANSRPRLRKLSQLRQLQADLEETEADWVTPAHEEGRCRSARLGLLKGEVDAWMLQPPPDDDWRRVEDAWAAVKADLGAKPPGGVADTTKLPKLQQYDRKAYQLSLVLKTQTDVANALRKEYGKNYNQGQVSRMIARAKEHAEASGLDQHIPSAPEKETSMDPERLELGPRVDSHAPRQRQRKSADAD